MGSTASVAMLSPLAVCTRHLRPASGLRPSRSATSAEITTIVAPVSTSICTCWPPISTSSEYWPPASAAMLFSPWPSARGDGRRLGGRGRRDARRGRAAAAADCKLNRSCGANSASAPAAPANSESGFQHGRDPSSGSGLADPGKRRVNPTRSGGFQRGKKGVAPIERAEFEPEPARGCERGRVRPPASGAASPRIGRARRRSAARKTAGQAGLVAEIDDMQRPARGEARGGLERPRAPRAGSSTRRRRRRPGRRRRRRTEPRDRKTWRRRARARCGRKGPPRRHWRARSPASPRRRRGRRSAPDG